MQKADVAGAQRAQLTRPRFTSLRPPRQLLRRGWSQHNVPGGVRRRLQHIGLTFDVGVGYNFSRNLGLRAEWQRYAEVGDDDEQVDIDVLSIGVLSRF